METPLYIPVKTINITSVIGNCNCEVYAIDSRVNPGGSHKDWPVARMLRKAVRAGARHIVDYTTGSEGISIGTLTPIPATIVMPNNITAERETLIRATGSTLILTPEREWVRGAVEAAMEMNDTGTILLNQSSNPENPLAFRDVAMEAAAQFSEPFDYVIACSGTGATIVGFGMAFRGISPTTQVVAVEPHKSPSTWALKNNVTFDHNPHKLWGTGAGAASPILQQGIDFIDSVALVDDEAAYAECLRLKKLGLPVGPTSAANIMTARQLSGRILTIIHDHADRYASVGL